MWDLMAKIDKLKPPFSGAIFKYRRKYSSFDTFY